MGQTLLSSCIFLLYLLVEDCAFISQWWDCYRVYEMLSEMWISGKQVTCALEKEVETTAVF